MAEQDEHPERSIAEQLEVNRWHLEGLRHQLADVASVRAEESRASAVQLDAIRRELGEAVRDRERLRREVLFSRRVIYTMLAIAVIILLVELLVHH